MSDPSSHQEQLVELTGLSAGQATARLVELAHASGYTVVAAGQGAFRLARSRRTMVVRKTTEGVSVSVFEDRGGTKARFVGPVDPALLSGLVAEIAGTRPGTGGFSGVAVVATSGSPTATHATGSFSAPLDSVPGVQTPAQSSPFTPVSPPDRSRVTWSAPAPGYVAEPAGWAQPGRPASHDDVDGRTIVRTSLATGPARMIATLPDGRHLELDRPVLCGRNPDPALGPAGAVLLALADPSLSKTHALFEVTAGTVYVTDLRSTNGTTIDVGGTAGRCTPATRSPVPDNAVVRLGEVPISIRAAR